VRLLDGCCGAGGASDGYAAAGFEVIGYDIAPQPNYPYEFWQGDVFDMLKDRALMCRASGSPRTAARGTAWATATPT
jgi:site-specific DNA-cytosine methylase